MAAFVQAAANHINLATQTSLTLPIPGVQNKGDLNLLFVVLTSGAVPSVTVNDTSLNAYTLLSAAGPEGIWIFAANGIAAAGAGANTISMSFASTGFPDACLLEYSGVQAFALADGVSAATGTGTAVSGPPLTAFKPGDIIAVCAQPNGASVLSAGSGFTSRVNEGTGFSMAEDLIASAAGVYTPLATLSVSVSWFLKAIALRAASPQVVYSDGFGVHGVG